MITYWHNPRCSKSRAGLALLEERGAEAEVRQYLKDAPSLEEIKTVQAALDLPAIGMMRTGEKTFKELDLSKDSAEAEAQEGDTAAAAATLAPKVTIVLGGATTEWCTRFLDSDGELQGDLIACGAVTYASRRAAIVCGRLAAVPSSLFENGLMFREPDESEWAYQGKIEPVEEEDE